MIGGIFEGLKVAEFAWTTAGPLVGKYLASQGATVVHLESALRPDVMRQAPPFKDNVPGLNRSGAFAAWNCNKYSMAINLGHPKGIEIAKKVIAWADIVTESFTPGVMDKLGLGYEQLKEMKADIIMISMNMQGMTGPFATHPGFGNLLSCLSGHSGLVGWPDRDPAGIWGAYVDHVAPLFSTAALLAALDYRKRTGKGQYLDFSQFEGAVHFLAPLVLDYHVNGRVAARAGNRCPYAAPHGAYPCRGKESWCTIAVFTDEEWLTFCRVMGEPEWTKSPKFATVLGRKENEEELDRRISEWTLQLEAEKAVEMLQAAGIDSGKVNSVADLYEDPQLKFRRHYWEIDHSEMGKHAYDGPGFILSKAPRQERMPAPLLGEHTEFVVTKILGMGDEEFVELLAEGVFE